MTEENRLLAILILIPVFVLSVIFLSRSRKAKEIEARRNYFKKLYNGQPFFLCDYIEEIDETVVQLFGEPCNTSLCPGMKITINGIEKIIKEVYANDDTPNEPDSMVMAGASDTPIIIEKSGWDWTSIQKDIKKNKLVMFKLS